VKKILFNVAEMISIFGIIWIAQPLPAWKGFLLVLSIVVLSVLNYAEGVTCR